MSLIVLKLFKNDKDDRNTQLIKFFIIFLNPFTLYGFIHASQISSILMFTTAFGFLLFLEKSPSKIFFWPITCLFLFVGSLIRFEFIHTFIIILIFYTLFRSKFIFSNLKTILNKKFIVKNSLIIMLFFLIKLIYVALSEKKTMGYVLPNVNTISFATYPPFDYYISQPIAVLIYLKNLLFPFSFTYYDNWHLWYQTFESPLLLILILLVIVLYFTTGFLSFKKNENLYLRCFNWAFFVFLSISFIYSSFIRVSWYYPAREVLGAIFFLGIITHFIKNNKVLLILCFYYSTSFIYLVSFPFQSFDNLYTHEKLFSSGQHPFLVSIRANNYYLEEDYEKALYGYEIIWNSIPESILAKSSRAGVFWSLALYGSYVTSVKLGSELRAKYFINQLLRSTYFPSTHACLQDITIPLKKCLSPDRIQNYCRMYSMGAMPKMFEINRLRKDPKVFCRRKI